MRPQQVGNSPAKASASSVCPLPDTPATPTISRSRAASKMGYSGLRAPAPSDGVLIGSQNLWSEGLR